MFWRMYLLDAEQPPWFHRTLVVTPVATNNVDERIMERRGPQAARNVERCWCAPSLDASLKSSTRSMSASASPQLFTKQCLRRIGLLWPTGSPRRAKPAVGRDLASRRDVVTSPTITR